jgi:dipeptidyl aminopeptidase/acylaminoacyl peptidase
MRRLLIPVFLVVLTPWLAAQPRPAATPGAAPMTMLSVDGIMRGPKLVGSAPTAVRWSKDSSKIYFSWQKADQDRASTYVVNRDGTGLRQMSADETRALDVPPNGRFDRERKRLLVIENGDVVVYDAASGARRMITRTAAVESNARWARNDTAITFVRDGNLYLMSLDGSSAPPFEQLTDIVAAEPPTSAAGAGAAGQRGAGAGRGAGGGRGAAVSGTATDTESQRYLRDEERNLIDYIKRQAEGRGGAAGGAGRGGRFGGAGGNAGPDLPIARFQLGPRQTLTDVQLSGDGKFAWIAVSERPEGTARNQDVPNYVTASSYPEMISGRTNVGDVQARRLLASVDLQSGKAVWADASAFAGMERKAKTSDADVPRLIDWSLPDTSDDGAQTIVAARSQDNKDRWYLKVDPATGQSTMLDHLHDDAWIREASIGGGGGGGFGGAGTGVAWLADNKRALFLSEKDGFMHVYSIDVSAATPAVKPLTSGKWEVASASLSADRKTVFLTTSEVHPGERHFYTMSVDGGPRTKLTTMTGSNEATVSPDEKSLAIVYSYSTKPPELYVMPFAAGGKMTEVTTTPTEEFRNFKWIDPKVITYKARDGQDVYARLFTPEMIGAKRDPKRPAVVFVHGAGYLQEAHKYWSSSYYRENMFNNILASRGYVVLSPDYRASAGYGRDWRTGIYRHMGGKDLDDVVDGAKFLVQTEKVDPKRIGVYGGSYGGFITLMAMFTTPDVFAAGAANRPVTDWAHYNHGYTSDILNVPQNDPEAYKMSSPIYFAEGLKGHLLINHGMVDTNVFFQDSVRLVQRLIELRKENWEIQPYPVENHAFTEETSWADEYKRILKLFEENLRR